MKKHYVKAEICVVCFSQDVILESGFRALNKTDNIGADPFSF
jgi:hypothetical protein